MLTGMELGNEFNQSQLNYDSCLYLNKNVFFTDLPSRDLKKVDQEYMKKMT